MVLVEGVSDSSNNSSQNRSDTSENANTTTGTSSANTNASSNNSTQRSGLLVSRMIFDLKRFNFIYKKSFIIFF
jgi:hypothetical protein